MESLEMDDLSVIWLSCCSKVLGESSPELLLSLFYKISIY